MIPTIEPSAVKKYLERRLTDFQMCLAAFETNDFKSIARVGHNMKGNGETFGFPELSTLGMQLETAALDQNGPATEAMIGKLGEWVETHLPEDFQ